MLLWQCAQVMTPTGGAKDINPPVVIQDKTFPANFSTNFNSETIVIEFDEYFNLSSPNSNVIITPTLENKPEFKVKKKRMYISLNNVLAVNTTYTINFGESISDITENNVLKNFKYVFSTGEFIDSLEVKGYVYDAFTKKPIEDAVVALYTNFEDSIPLKEKPYYFTKTIKSGWFNISNVKASTYKLAALKEENLSLIYDSPDELFAFSDTLITVNRLDSTDGKYKLYAFRQEEKKLYVTEKKYRKNNLVSLKFNKILREEPKLSFIPKVDFETYFFPNTDSIQYFLKDTILVKKAVLNEMDTLNLNPPSNKKYSLKLNIENSSLLPTDTLKISSSVPFKAHADTSLIRLTKDSVEVPFKYNVKGKSLLIYFEKEALKDYQLTLLPNAVKDFWGKTTDTIREKISVLNKEYYGSIVLSIDSLNPEKSYILQLLNKNKNVIEERSGNTFNDEIYTNLEPGEYHFRLIEDRNNNGYWDSGNYLEKKQPEPIYNFGTSLTVRSNWDLNETWVISSEN